MTWFDSTQKKPKCAEEGIKYVYSTNSKKNPDGNLQISIRAVAKKCCLIKKTLLDIQCSQDTSEHNKSW